MRDFLRVLREVDWISLAFEIGIAIFVLVTFVRCTFPAGA